MSTNYAKNLLQRLISFESVSADPKRHDALIGAAEFIKTELENIGFKVELVNTQTPRPLICAFLNGSENGKMIGVYAHYDVQPEDPLGEWDSEPFVLTEKNAKFYGRGVADDKGHLAQAISAIKELKSEGEPRNSIVFVFEGEEEAGIAKFEELLQDVKIVDLSKVDVWYVLDMGMKSKGVPQIFTGLRGIVSGELVIETSQSDAHSGIFGNRIPSAAQLLVNIFASVKDQTTGKVNIPGFYDDILPVSIEEYSSLVENADTIDELKERSKTHKVLENQFVPDMYPANMPVSLYSKLLPSFEINGIWSGYTGIGTKTIIPGRGSAKFSVRVVQGQNGEKMKKLISAYFAGIIPKWAKYKLTLGSSEAVGTNTDNVWIDRTKQILEKHFNQKIIFNRSGGSIPAAEILSRLYQKPIVMMGFTLPDENIHAPNENIDKDMFFEGIKVLKNIFTI
ncbi:MAG: M20/M25/M40 family metallo-hydrolase [Patescibacteria group bacterium]